MVELTVRVVFSLAVVLGLLMLCVRFAGNRFQGRSDALVKIVHRQPLGRHATVSVVDVNGRFLVLGTTDQEVRLLTELDPESFVLDGKVDTLLTLVSDPGTPEQGIELDVGPVRREQIAEPVTRTGRHISPRHVDRTQPASTGRASLLGGSILSTRTWRQAWGAVMHKAS